MNKNVNSEVPLILAVASGKGGVGKTVIAVAAARELSRSTRTLILDLDFFNRGLTGLLNYSHPRGSVKKPAFLGESKDEYWRICEVSDNFYYVRFPDTSEEEIATLESMGIDELTSKLKSFILEAAKACDCHAVVLDCHGGPDSASFAACCVADKTLLVAEPDRVTWYGTLHFLRKLGKATRGKSHNVHLVFNKVTESVSNRFLCKIYKQQLQQYFNEYDLAAIFPMEVELTQSFERSPLLTDIFPASTLTRKTHVMLYDLFAKTHRHLLSRVILSMPYWLRSFRRATMGRVNPWLRPSAVVLAGFWLVLTAMLISLLVEEEVVNKGDVTDFLEKMGFELSIAFLSWVAIAFLLDWTRSTDRKMTYYSRRGNYVLLFVMAFSLNILWVFPVSAIGMYLPSMLENNIGLVGRSAATIFLTFVIFIWSEQVYRAYRYYRYEGYTMGPALRIFMSTNLAMILGYGLFFYNTGQ